MKKKVNFKRLSLDKLQEQYGMTRNEAITTWNRMYQKAARQIRNQGANKQLNVTRELHASLFNRGTSLFKVDLMQASPSVSIKEQYKGKGELLVKFTGDRMQGFFNKYPEAKSIYDEYKKGKITFEEFKQQIKNFQDMNPEYQSQHYEVNRTYSI